MTSLTKIKKAFINRWLCLAALIGLFATDTFAQTLTIAGGTSGSHLYNLTYTWYQAPRTQRMATHIPSAQIAAGGMVSGATITAVELERLTGNTLALPAGANMKIYLKNLPSSSLDLGAGTLTWATEISGAAFVYDGDPSVPLSNSPGWKMFSFGTGTGTSSSFVYTGGAIAVYSDYIHTTAIGGSTAIPMMYATTAQGTPIPNGQTTNTTKYTNNSTTTPSTTMASSSSNRPHMRFTYTTSGCSNPPTAGTTSVVPNTGLCVGSNISLSLSGNSTGSGLTFQWQSSTTNSAPWTNVGSLQTSPSLITPATVSTYYRCELICNSGTPQYSTSVQATVDPPFAGGTYTINSALPTSGSNFQTFNAFKNAIACGISGAVVVNVVSGSGPYNEQVEFPVIGGTSSTNTITINGNGTTMSFAGTAAIPHTFGLNGTDYMTVNNLNIVGTDATNSISCHLWNDANNNSFNACNITAPQTGTGSAYAAFAINGGATGTTTTGNSGSNNIISNCNISGGYYTAIITGATTGTGNQLLNNNISEFYLYGVYHSYCTNTLIKGNTIERPTRTSISTGYGLYVTTSTSLLRFDGNTIKNFFNAVSGSSLSGYGIYVVASSTAGNENKYVNNYITNIESATGLAYAVYVLGYNYHQFYHNTIELKNTLSTAGTTAGFYGYGTGTEVKDNIITITRSGSGTKYCLYFSSTNTTSSNYNVLHMGAPAGTNYIGYYSTGFSTLTAWKTANGGTWDQNSVSVNPLLSSGIPTVGTVNDIGTPVGVLTDIIGTTRSLTTPDVGAYEFSLGGLDASISWVSPTSPTTAGLYTITVNIANTQAQPITDLQLTYNYGSGPIAETFSGLNILSGNNQNISFTTQFNFTSNVTVTANIVSVNGGADAISSNNTVSYSLCISLSGAYTINSAVATGGTNFQTFTAAINALACGITNPVVFNVAAGSGPYNEQVTIPVISGASAINTITINGNGRTLTFAGTAGIPHTLGYNGADYITLNNLIINGTDGTNALTVHLWNGADNNTFNNCTFSSSLSATGTIQSPFSISGTATSATATGTAGSNNTVSGCTLVGGYYGLALSGSTASTGTQILNNTITDFYSYGIYHYYHQGSVVRGNIIERTLARTNATTTYGIYIGSSVINLQFDKNRLRNFFGFVSGSSSSSYGIYNIVSATAGNENRYTNNLITRIESASGTCYGMYALGYNYNLFYHNTVVLDNPTSTAGTTAAFYGYGTGTELKNNILHVSRAGSGTKYCIYFSATNTTVSNNNAVYMAAPAGLNYVGYYSTTFTTLANWQTANGGTWDQQSVHDNPLYINPGTGNYKPASVVLDNIGTPLASVTTDIANTLRSPSAPDPGAYEFTVAAKDVGVFAIVSPNTSGCYSNAETFVVTLKNYGTQNLDFSVDPVTINCVIAGPVNTTISATLTSGILASGATQNVSLSPTVDGTANGTYTINATAVMASDGESSNDAFPEVSITVGTVAGTVSSTLNSICVSGSPVLSLVGAYGGAIQWQESTTSATGPWTNVGTNSTTYNPGTINQSTWYQALTVCNSNTSASNVVAVTVNSPTVLTTTPGSRCGIGTVSLGATGSGSALNWYATPTSQTSIGTGNTFTTPVITNTTPFYVAASDGGSNVNVGKVGLESNAGTGGGLTTYMNFDAVSNFTLQSVVLFPYGATDNSPGTVTIELRTSTGTPIMSQTVNVIAHSSVALSVPQTVTLNFPVTGGASYRLGVNSWTGGVTNLYRDDNNFTYPYTVPGTMSITGPSTVGYFYFFYNWTVSTGCESPRTMVTATVTPPPSLSVNTTDPTVCPGGSTTVYVNSSNDPDYTYSWTSNPSGFTASGAGTHTVTPTATTWYVVTATDNSAGPNAGCVNRDSVQVITGAVLSGGTVSASQTTFCQSGVPTLSVTGADGGALQWQSSTVSSSGPWTNVGTGSTVYAPGMVTQTTWYQLRVSCQSTQVYSNVVEVTVNNPQITSSNGGTRCGPGTVTLTATALSGSINWYATSSSTTSLATGSSYSPNVPNTTTYYAAASFGGGGVVSLGRPNRTDLTANTSVNTGLVFSAPTGGTLQSVSVYPSGTGAGTLKVVLKTGNTAAAQRLDSVTVNLTGTAIASAVKTLIPLNFVVPPGTGYYLSAETVSGGVTGFGRELSNGGPYPFTAVGTDWQITGSWITTGAPTTSTYYYFYDWQISQGCEGTRVPVVATVTPSPSVNVSVQHPTICTGQSATLSVTSSNPGYSYTWNPGALTGSSVTVTPSSNTTYTLNAIDISGGVYDQCTAIASTTVNTSAALPPDLSTSGGGSACEGNNITLSVSNNAAGQTSGNTYAWTTDAPTSFTSTQQTPTVTGSSTVGNSGNYTVVVTNSFLCTASAVEVVTVNPNPTLSVVSTQNVGCVGGSDGIITVSASNGTPVYNYSSDGFATQNNSGVMTNLPTGPTTIQVQDDNGCIGSITQSLTAISSVPPSAAVVVPFIGMPTHVCNGTTATLSIPAVSNTTMYIWDAPGTAYFNGNPLNVSPFTTSTPSVTVTYGNPSGSLYTTGVQAANGCGQSLRKIQKTRGTISVPASITGALTACENTNGNYSTGAVDAASSYLWTITGDATVSGTGTTATVSFGPAWNGGTLCVSAQTTCYTSPAKCITINKSAAALGAISGTFTACPNTTLNYSVPASAGAASYTWTLPPGATGASSTNSISVNYGAGYSAVGSICVSVTSICGVTSALKCKTVAPGLPSQPASISGELTGLCNQTKAYNCPSQGVGVTYNWTAPAGTIITGNGSTAITAQFGNLTTGNVCVTASSSCGSSAARCVPVKGAPATPGAITATPSSWCANTPGIQFDVNVGGLSGAYTLSWMYPTSPIATYLLGGGNSTQLLMDWLTGTGNINVTASNACGSGTKTSTWSSTCRESEVGTVSTLTVSPNPTTGVLNVNYTATKGHTAIQVLDLTGRVVFTQNTNSIDGVNNTQLDMSKLAKGAYMLSVQSTQGNKQVRIVVE